ncbi:MAG: hypothetical protein ACOC9Y_04415 [Chloroflexota bacterium]
MNTGPPAPPTMDPGRVPPPRRERRPILTPDWRRWVLSGLVRGGVALGFAGVPAVEVRFGDAALVIVCCVLAICVGLVVGLEWYTRASAPRRDLVVDVVSLLCLTPILMLAGELLVADGRFGGRTSNVLAMLGVTLLVMAILTLIGRTGADPVAQPNTLSILPSALMVAAVVGGPRLYATAQIWQGMSLAWMIAGIVTMLALVLGHQGRLIAAIGSIIIFAGSTMFVSSMRDGPNINTEAASIGVVAVALTIGIVVFEAFTQPRTVTSGPDQRWAEYR